jgi:hypothetical protein
VSVSGSVRFFAWLLVVLTWSSTGWGDSTFDASFELLVLEDPPPAVPALPSYALVAFAATMLGFGVRRSRNTYA